MRSLSTTPVFAAVPDEPPSVLCVPCNNRYRVTLKKNAPKETSDEVVVVPGTDPSLHVDRFNRVPLSNRDKFLVAVKYVLFARRGDRTPLTRCTRCCTCGSIAPATETWEAKTPRGRFPKTKSGRKLAPCSHIFLPSGVLTHAKPPRPPPRCRQSGTLCRTPSQVTSSAFVGSLLVCHMRVVFVWLTFVSCRRLVPPFPLRQVRCDTVQATSPGGSSARVRGARSAGRYDGVDG